MHYSWVFNWVDCDWVSPCFTGGFIVLSVTRPTLLVSSIRSERRGAMTASSPTLRKASAYGVCIKQNIFSESEQQAESTDHNILRCPDPQMRCSQLHQEAFLRLVALHFGQ